MSDVNNNIEEWRQYLDWPYDVSDRGRVRRARTHRLLRPVFRSKNYYSVTLSRGGMKKKIYVHQLVARTFLPNPLGKPEVDHRNNVRTDNSATNLRWCTSSENKQNRGKQSNNTSGYVGAFFDSARGRYAARTEVGKKRYFLGHFMTAQEAGLVAEAFRREHNKEFFNC